MKETNRPSGQADDALLREVLEYDQALASDTVDATIKTTNGSSPQCESLFDCADLLERYRRYQDMESASAAARRDSNCENDGALSHAPLQMPSQIGRFQIVRELGRGSGGVVLLAIDPKLDRQVALKIMRPEAVIFPELKDRFLREAQAAARLRHPNIVEVFEVGEVESYAFIAASYCDGGSLAEWLAKQPDPIPCRVAAEIISQVTDAVAHAHNRGVLHRDIKPSNILIEHQLQPFAADSDSPQYSPGESAPKVRLTDFGLARFLDDETTASLTRHGATLGTPQYMAPEQRAGAVAELGTHTDVWSVGAVLYELLTRKYPSQGDESPRQMHANEPKPIRSLRADVPRDLVAICEKCLAPRIGDRYPTATELAHDLQLFLTGRPTTARPLSPWGRTFRWAKNHKVFASLVTLIGLLIASIAGMGWWSSREIAAALEENRRMLYVADVKLAAEATEQFQARRARQLLQRYMPVAGQTDRRRFPWHYLWSQLHTEWSVLRPPGEQPTALRCFDLYQDGRLVVAGDGQGQLWFWDRETNGLVDRRSIHQHGVASLTAAGSCIVSCDYEGAVICWDGNKRTSQQLDVPPAEFVTASHQHELLAIGLSSGPIQLLDHESCQAATTLAGHQGAITHLAFFPISQRIASVGKDRVIRIWVFADAAKLDCEELSDSLVGDQKFGQGRMRFDSVAVSPDERLLAAGTNRGHVFVWDLNSGQEIYRWRDHTSNVLKLSFSLDSKKLASASKDSTVRIWDVDEGVPHEVFQGHGRPVYDVRFLADDSLLSAGKDGSIRHWSLKRTCYTERRVQTRNSQLRAMSSDGRRAGLMQWRGDVFTYNLEEQQLRSVPHLHTQAGSLQFSADSRYLVTAGGPCLWPGDPAAAVEQPRPQFDLMDLDGDGDEDRVAVFHHSCIVVWQENTAAAGYRPPRIWSRVEAFEDAPIILRDSVGEFGLRYSPGRHLLFQFRSSRDLEAEPRIDDIRAPRALAIVNFDNDADPDALLAEQQGSQLRWCEVLPYHFQHKRLTLTLPAAVEALSGHHFFEESIFQLAILTVAGDLILCSQDTSDATTFSISETLASGIEYPAILSPCDVDRDGRDDLLVSTRAETIWFQNSGNSFERRPSQVASLLEMSDQIETLRTNVVVWNAKKERVYQRLRTPSHCVQQIAITPSGLHLATYGNDQRFRIWEMNTGRLVKTLPRYELDNRVQRMVFGSDEKELLVACGDDIFSFALTSEANQPPRVFSGHDNSVEVIVTSPSDTRFASLSHDLSVRVWDTVSGAELQSLIGHRQNPVAASFSADGTLLATAEHNGTINIWDVDTGQDLITLRDLRCDEFYGLTFPNDSTLLSIGFDNQSSQLKIGTWDVSQDRPAE